MNNKSEIKRALKVALIKAQKSKWITPILEPLMIELEELLNKGVANDNAGER